MENLSENLACYQMPNSEIYKAISKYDNTWVYGYLVKADTYSFICDLSKLTKLFSLSLIEGIIHVYESKDKADNDNSLVDTKWLRDYFIALGMVPVFGASVCRCIEVEDVQGKPVYTHDKIISLDYDDPLEVYHDGVQIFLLNLNTGKEIYHYFNKSTRPMYRVIGNLFDNYKGDIGE